MMAQAAPPAEHSPLAPARGRRAAMAPAPAASAWRRCAAAARYAALVAAAASAPAVTPQPAGCSAAASTSDDLFPSKLVFGDDTQARARAATSRDPSRATRSGRGG